MRRCLTLVLAGGEGRRLFPLTLERSKPAVFFGGRYRLVDFALSNLVNSGFTRIKVLTQYRATSLVQHLTRAWSLATNNLDQYVEPVPAAMNLGKNWFRGTADAIWQNLDLLRDVRPDDVLIFGADHVYKMDVSLMLKHHRETDADVTIATTKVPRGEASSFGCVAVNDDGMSVENLTVYPGRKNGKHGEKAHQYGEETDPAPVRSLCCQLFLLVCRPDRFYAV